MFVKSTENVLEAVEKEVSAQNIPWCPISRGEKIIINRKTRRLIFDPRTVYKDNINFVINIPIVQTFFISKETDYSSLDVALASLVQE